MTKPLPRFVAWDEPFWKYARQDILTVQKCRLCGRLQFFPRPVCVSCFGRDLDWQLVSGRGCIHSFTLVRVPVHPDFKAEVPIIIAEIELEEGVRILSRIVKCAPEDVEVGKPVAVIFLETTDEAIRLPHFELAR